MHLSSPSLKWGSGKVDLLSVNSAYEETARRAMDRAALRASILVDRELVIRWASNSTARLLGVELETFVGSSALDHLHPDDLVACAEILAFEADVDPHFREVLTVRSVREVQIRRSDGAYGVFEASLSNFYDDPDIGMLLLDVQAPTQYRFVERAIALTHSGAGLGEILKVVLTSLTAADPWELAAAITDANGELLAATATAPDLLGGEPRGCGPPHPFKMQWSVELRAPDQEARLGELFVWSHFRTPHPLDLESSHRVARHAAVVIAHHLAVQELRRAAMHDALTGLSNRRVVDQELAARRERDDSVLVAYLDLDGFKAVNDRFGHDAGDAVLITVADRLRSTIRANDIVARVGGDEFVIVFGSPTPDAPLVRERLKLALREPIAVGDDSVSIAASIGFSHGPADARSLLKAADQQMLAMKHR